MEWTRRANDVLERATGLRATRATRVPRRSRRARRGAPVTASARPPARPAIDRLLKAPVFVFSPPRSGSTLLRVVLNSHSQLHAPHETHVRMLTLNLRRRPTVVRAMAGFGHNRADLEHLLWDRMLHRELQLSGKETIVEKTPANVFVWRRIATCWPDARFIFLIRHPASIARSWHEGDPARRPMSKAVPHILRYAQTLETARQTLPGLTVRYEDMTEDPKAQTQRICEFLGLDWEPEMVDYGRNDHGPYVMGFGDWKEKIKTGTIQPGRGLPAPEEVPHELRDMCRTWGY
ncbi:sulfotransferase family protein [Streptomyces sp. 6N223]|uniref:sulfotransferase family protein n=1 Tax=Streptomyces sp. 6N223 TaxID=3457412 RepID=UPI003FD2DC6C